MHVTINSIILKVAARCNINCDYCYVFQHADQSTKKQPRLLSKEHLFAFARQVDAYLDRYAIPEMSICFHGGEPLLAGLSYYEDLFAIFQQGIRRYDNLSLAIQTNGILLNRKFLDLFRANRVQVALSLDGPASANDKHRLDYRGRSTYESVFQALALLRGDYRDVFSGVLSVIDPTNTPEEIIDFFAEIDPPSYNMLLPDANYCRPPPGRERDPDLYINWLKRALIHWHTHQRQLRIRTFVDLFQGLMGIRTESEFFGNGAVSYIVVETDGSYHCSDILKTTYAGASHTGLFVKSATIDDVVQSSVIQDYSSMLKVDQKCVTCLKCPELSLCGAGQIAHRYNAEGFDNPSIYCREILALTHQARHLLLKKRLEKVAFLPNFNEKQIVQVFLSENSCYLLMILVAKEIPVDEVLMHPSISAKSYEGQQALSLLNKMFHHFETEYGLLCQDLPTAESPSSMKYAETILTFFLTKKFDLFDSCYALTYSQDHEELLRSLYRCCYTLRFWQSMMAHDAHSAYHLQITAIRSDIAELLKSLSTSDLSEMGQELLEQLVEEFVPSFLRL